MFQVHIYITCCGFAICSQSRKNSIHLNILRKFTFVKNGLQDKMESVPPDTLYTGVFEQFGLRKGVKNSSDTLCHHTGKTEILDY